MSAQQEKLKILVTGAYGLIGNLVYARLAEQPEQYEVYGSSRRPNSSQRASEMQVTPIPKEMLRVADLTDFEATKRIVEGVDVIVHMAADPSGIPGWESVLNNNIIGSYNLFEAARLAGVKRVVYASSNQVSFGYRDQEPYRSLFAGRIEDIDPEEIAPIDQLQPTRPLNLYACSKVFGEALAHMYANVHGVSSLVLRIGWVLADDKAPMPYGHSVWCSQRDCVQLVERAIRAPDSLRFDVFYVQSKNPYNFVDIQHASDVLGYAPLDSAEDPGRARPAEHLWK